MKNDKTYCLSKTCDKVKYCPHNYYTVIAFSELFQMVNMAIFKPSTCEYYNKIAEVRFERD